MDFIYPQVAQESLKIEQNKLKEKRTVTDIWLIRE